MKISVIIPVRNEEASVRELLDGLTSQTRLPDEIVITDGGSTDTTVRVIEDYSSGAPLQIRLLREKAALPGRGRNVAASNSSGEWLAFIDAGIRPEKDWLAQLAKRTETEEAVDVVYGSWAPVVDTFFKECAAIAYVPPPMEHDGVLSRPRSIASSLMRREVWQAVGGFPEHLRSAEDLIFMDHIQAANFHSVFEPSALVHWDIQPGLRRTFQRFVSYSSNNIQAGLWKHWQAVIFRRYGLLLVLGIPVLFLSWGWLIVVLLWLLLLSSRAVVALWRNRNCFRAGPLRNLRRFFYLLLILATLDAAAMWGSLQWLIRDRFLFVDETANAGNRA